jgi:hypothetical protein
MFCDVASDAIGRSGGAEQHLEVCAGSHCGSQAHHEKRWAILSFFYSRYMLRSERAFEGLPDIEWPGVHPLAVELGKLCAMKSERFASGPKAGLRPTPVEALRILFTGVGEYLTHPLTHTEAREAQRIQTIYI